MAGILQIYSFLWVAFFGVMCGVPGAYKNAYCGMIKIMDTNNNRVMKFRAGLR